MTDSRYVDVEVDGGTIVRRALVAVENEVFFVCLPEEYVAALREKREPVCTGFRREYVLNLKGDRLSG
jgi:hypothetical protein